MKKKTQPKTHTGVFLLGSEALCMWLPRSINMNISTHNIRIHQHTYALNFNAFFCFHIIFVAIWNSKRFHFTAPQHYPIVFRITNFLCIIFLLLLLLLLFFVLWWWFLQDVSRWRTNSAFLWFSHHKNDGVIFVSIFFSLRRCVKTADTRNVRIVCVNKSVYYKRSVYSPSGSFTIGVFVCIILLLWVTFKHFMKFFIEWIACASLFRLRVFVMMSIIENAIHYDNNFRSAITFGRRFIQIPQMNLWFEWHVLNKHSKSTFIHCFPFFSLSPIAVADNGDCCPYLYLFFV